MDLSGVLSSFDTETRTVTRPSNSYDANGVFSATTSTFSATLLEQPLTGKELQRLPEGLRGEEVRAFWATAELRVKDSIDISGTGWQVERVEDWSTHGGYWRVLAKKEGN